MVMVAIGLERFGENLAFATGRTFRDERARHVLSRLLNQSSIEQSTTQ